MQPPPADAAAPPPPPATMKAALIQKLTLQTAGSGASDGDSGSGYIPAFRSEADGAAPAAASPSSSAAAAVPPSPAALAARPPARGQSKLLALCPTAPPSMQVGSAWWGGGFRGVSAEFSRASVHQQACRVWRWPGAAQPMGARP